MLTTHRPAVSGFAGTVGGVSARGTGVAQRSRPSSAIAPAGRALKSSSLGRIASSVPAAYPVSPASRGGQVALYIAVTDDGGEPLQDVEPADVPGPVSDALAALARLLFVPASLAGSVALLVVLSALGVVDGPHRQPLLVVALEICLAPPVLLVVLALAARRVGQLVTAAAWSLLAVLFSALERLRDRTRPAGRRPSRTGTAPLTVYVTDLPRRDPGGGRRPRALPLARPALPPARRALASTPRALPGRAGARDAPTTTAGATGSTGVEAAADAD